ncbi:hypothetical protein PISMIDRAFT_116079 [Pisolithus microcarpus 441]|uniref:DDE Tnp4 domain-containing protein n=1 Tax=Pisolithus microcarpus 441 TaxID=765257 RepID=A0A0C9Z4L6_9AGAM|nr:hypothetical protein PISMIDRAFT_116079 [Pisolithus microcarpus 441]
MDKGEVHQELIHERALILIPILINLVVDLVSKGIPKDPQPYHTSALSGEAWLVELVLGHPDHIHCELGVSAHVFKEITLDLQNHGHRSSKHISLGEQLAIFLYTCVTVLPTRHVGEHFRRSNDMVSRYFWKMVSIFSSELFYSKYILLPFASSATTVHPYIQENSQFWPYFKDVIGAIDGSHIPAAPPLHDHAAYHNRKGSMSQNCLFACDFGMRFSYVLTGWEGSATDARIFQEACASSLDIPHGKYFLGNAGFPLSPGVLVPYCCRESILPRAEIINY